MDRLQTISYKGKTVVWVDFSKTNIEEARQLFAAVSELVQDKPPASVLVLSDLTDTHFDTQLIQDMKRYLQHDAAKMRAQAVLGVGPLQSVIVGSMSFLFRSVKVHVASSKQEALDWLVSVAE